MDAERREALVALGYKTWCFGWSCIISMGGEHT